MTVMGEAADIAVFDAGEFEGAGTAGVGLGAGRAEAGGGVGTAVWHAPGWLARRWMGEVGDGWGDCDTLEVLGW